MNNKVEVSIWGIRSGFEDKGMYHSHSISEVLEIQQKDNYRILASFIRPKDAYLIQRTQNYVILSLIHTNVFESGADRRPGYVIFSLIIKKGLSFTDSPSKKLIELVDFYKQRVGNSNLNNFTEGQILPFVKGIETKNASLFEKSEKAYTFFDGEGSIDGLLKCDLAFSAYKELLLIPKAINITDLGFTESFVKIDIKDEESRFLQSESERKIKEQKNKDLEIEIQKNEDDFLRLYDSKNLEDALRFASLNEYSNQFSKETKRKISVLQVNQNKNKAETTKKEENIRNAGLLNKSFERHDLSRATAYLKILSDPSVLNPKVLKSINDYIRGEENKLKAKNSQEADDLDKKKKKKNNRIFLFSSLFGVFVILFVISYSLSIPVSLYDRDNDDIVNSKDDCPDDSGTVECNGCPDKDGDGVPDFKKDADGETIIIDKCPEIPGTEECEGCPENDCDCDGVIGGDDKCPNEKGSMKCYGCLDSDDDGIRDTEDVCPNKPGTIENDGCPPEDPIDANIQNLKDGKAIQLKEIGEHQTLNNKWIKIKDGKWCYSNSENNSYKDVKSQESYNLLNSKFSMNLVLSTTDVNPTPVPTPTPTPTPEEVVEAIKVPDSHLTQMENLYKRMVDEGNKSENEIREWDDLYQVYKSNLDKGIWKINRKIDTWHNMYKSLPKVD